MIDQPDAQRFVGVDERTGRGDLLRLGEAHRTRQQRRHPPPGQRAELGVGVGEARPFRREHDVAAEHQLEPAGDARAVHRRDHRLPDRPQRGTGVGRREGRTEGHDLLDVGAGREHGIDRSEHDHVDCVVTVDLARELLDPLAHRERERVLGIGPVDGEREHPIRDLGAKPLDGNRLVHGPTFSRELSQVMRSRSGVIRRSRRPTS